jgi:hypothetical protein
MMWNHRIVATVDETGGEYLEIVEVFYDSDKVPYAYGAATIGGEDVDELYKQVERFKKSLESPILKYPEHFTGDVNK